MKKKMATKLSLNKLTITTLNDQTQSKVKGGETCWATCDTCFSDCGQETCAGPTCFESCPIFQCTEIYTCNRPCIP